jgi:hypothetical protein
MSSILDPNFGQNGGSQKLEGSQRRVGEAQQSLAAGDLSIGLYSLQSGALRLFEDTNCPQSLWLQACLFLKAHTCLRQAGRVALGNKLYRDTTTITTFCDCNHCACLMPMRT